MTNEKETCSRCGKCCMGIIVPFLCDGGSYAEHLKIHGCKQIPGIGTWIPSRCPHLEFNPAENNYFCDIYETRPKVCHADYNTATIKQFRPKGCTHGNK